MLTNMNDGRVWNHWQTCQKLVNRIQLTCIWRKEDSHEQNDEGARDTCCYCYERFVPCWKEGNWSRLSFLSRLNRYWLVRIFLLYEMMCHLLSIVPFVSINYFISRAELDGDCFCTIEPIVSKHPLECFWLWKWDAFRNTQSMFSKATCHSSFGIANQNDFILKRVHFQYLHLMIKNTRTLFVLMVCNIGQWTRTSPFRDNFSTSIFKSQHNTHKLKTTSFSETKSYKTEPTKVNNTNTTHTIKTSN